MDEQLRKLRVGNQKKAERDHALTEDGKTSARDVLLFANYYGWTDDFGHLYLDVLDEWHFWTKFDPYDRPNPITATAWFIYGCFLRDAWSQVWLANRRCNRMKTHRDRVMAGEWPLDDWTPKDMDAAVDALEVERRIQSGEWPLWESPEDVKTTILAMEDCWRDEWTDLVPDMDNESAARIVLGLESVDRVRKWKEAWKRGKDKLLRNLVGDGKGTFTKGAME